MKHLHRALVLCLIIIVALALAQGLRAQEVEKININLASGGELKQLKGIGPKLAERIVLYREEHGPFRVPEDIMKVKGIGPKKWEANKHRITVAQPQPQFQHKP